jgi:hypothetical protein
LRVSGACERRLIFGIKFQRPKFAADAHLGISADNVGLGEVGGAARH